MHITNRLLKRILLMVMVLVSFYPLSAQHSISDKGISKQLALQRAATISNIQYQLSFSIPDVITESITGELLLKIKLNKVATPLILDFNAPTENIQKIETASGRKIKWQHINGHLILPISVLKLGDNNFRIVFKAGEQSLNRNKEFLYTLFVPARASTAFPCFDQPDLKAIFTLKLEIPSGWVATANGKLKDCTTKEDRSLYAFEPTHPISTYLFSFVAGKFKTIHRDHNAIAYSFFYRDSDSLKMTLNIDSIFKQVFLSIDWMEKFTGIKQPFEKYDFIAIPSFQYGGMEHPGAILYNAQRIILDESATQEDELNRANLIAHETAHLWFGDLVTMKWFDDVWLKEVFANFMADKIVNPMYPGMNHALRFLLTHQPRAYAIDRTQGANPIKQTLDNLAEAGSLYGNIIYHKSPIVMNQLEQLMGFDAFQKGLQQYLQTYRFGNADWDDLITILEHSTTKDLRTWSNIWVKEAGMPHYIVSTTLSADLRYHVTVDQKDPTGKNRIWPQYLTFTVHNNTYFIKQEIFTNNANITTTPLSTEPIYILPNITERGYGYFELDPKSKRYLLQNIQTISDPLIRGIVWLSLREMVIDHKIDPEDYFSTLCSSLKTEQEEQLINFLVTDIQMTYWKFLNPLQQSHVAESLPELLLTKLNTAETKSLKATYLKTLIYTTQKSCIGMDTLYAIWSGAHPIPGLKLSDNDYRIMACELAVRDYPDAKKVLATQIERIKDKDLRERLVYLLSSLSDNKEERDLFFHQLMNSAMREHEPWAAEALGYLNHPLREADSEGYILPGLNILEEIRATGDIFFPVDWLNALLSGHSSPEAARIVRSFLKTHPNYPPDLRLKILQSADNLLRRNPV